MLVPCPEPVFAQACLNNFSHLRGSRACKDVYMHSTLSPPVTGRDTVAHLCQPPHLANAAKFRHIRIVNALIDLHIPVLATPEQLMEVPDAD